MILVNTKSVTTHEFEDHGDLNILEFIEPTDIMGLPACPAHIATHCYLPPLAAGNINRAVCLHLEFCAPRRAFELTK